MKQMLKGQVAVAVSGGMDSLYSLISLQEQGADLFALHALFLPEYLRAPQAQDDLCRLEAATSALGVALHVVDLSCHFEQLVIRPFIESYLMGNTPNPCARCNNHLKFGLLWNEAKRLGAAHIATGHYVKLLKLPAGADLVSGADISGVADLVSGADILGSADILGGLPSGLSANLLTVSASSGSSSGLVVSSSANSLVGLAVCPPVSSSANSLVGKSVGLFAGDDAGKDQSYFLAMTPIEKLAKAIFPLAERKKSDIAAELATLGVEVPQKGESQEICFINNNDYRAFIKEHAPRFGFALPSAGNSVLPSGQIVGRHSGLWAYTQGQRHGLGIAWKEPLYVLGKNHAANQLIVGARSDFGHKACLCTNINFMLPPEAWPEKVLVKTRYRQEPQLARPELWQEAGQMRLALHFEGNAVQAPVAPGQIAALYIETKQGLRLVAGAEIIG